VLRFSAKNIIKGRYMKKNLVLLAIFLVGCQSSKNSFEVKPKLGDDICFVEGSQVSFTVKEIAELNKLTEQQHEENLETLDIESSYIKFYDSYKGSIQFTVEKYKSLSDEVEIIDNFYGLNADGKITVLNSYGTELQIINGYVKTDEYEFFSTVSENSSVDWNKELKLSFFVIKDEEITNLLDCKIISGRTVRPFIHVFQNEIYILYTEGIEGKYYSFFKKYDGDSLITIWQSDVFCDDYACEKYKDNEYLTYKYVQSNDRYFVFSTKNEETLYIHYYDGILRTLAVENGYDYFLVGNKIVYMVKEYNWSYTYHIYDISKNEICATNFEDIFGFYGYASPLYGDYTAIFIDTSDNYNITEEWGHIIILKDGENEIYYYEIDIQGLRAAFDFFFNETAFLIAVSDYSSDSFYMPEWLRYYKLEVNEVSN